MSDALIGAATALFRRLLASAGRDADLRADLRALAEAILAETETPADAPWEQPATTPPETVVGGEDRPSPAEIVTPSPSPPPAERVTSVLTLGQAVPDLPEVPSRPSPAPFGFAVVDDEELPRIEARCRLKAEGVRWAATRYRRIADGADFQTEIAPKDREIADRARQLPDCYIWMNTPDAPIPRDPDAHDDLAAGFETVADAVALVREILGDRVENWESFEQGLDLLAEAQSALRAAIRAIDGPTDADQYKVFNWLRATTQNEQIYIRRYMRAGDPADPARLPDLADRLEALDASYQEARRRAKRRRSRRSRLGYHAKLIADRDGGESGYDWGKVAEAIEEMIDDGMPPSNPEVREILLPILDDLPDAFEPPRGLALVLREVDRYLGTRPTAPATNSPRALNAEVVRVARGLAGKDVVLIGGERRPGAQDALRAALGLSDLIWIETREHQSIEGFEPYVARPDVAVVLLAIRWSSHSFGDVKKFCESHGKPLVRLPGGYNPNQVAVQVLAQASGPLGLGRPDE